MLISSNAPFSAGFARIFSAFSFVLSVGSTTLLAILSVYAWLDESQLRVPFVIAAAFNIIATTLILAFSLWRFTVLVTVLAGLLPSFLIALGTGGLWAVSVIQFRWLPALVVARDTKWILTATITFWVFTLAVQVVFWTLLIAFRSRLEKTTEEDIMKQDAVHLSREISDPDPVTDHSGSENKIETEARPMMERGNTEPSKSRNRSLPKPIRAFIFPRGSPTTAPRSTRNPLEPSPFSQSTSNLPLTSPFLNLLNRPKPKTAPNTPQGLTFPLPITEQEASNLAAFDEWDTSSLSMQDRILYSIAAAEGSDPGAPPHALTTFTDSTLASSDLVRPRSHRSSSAPTPPRTPPQRLRTSSVGSYNSRSNSNSQQSIHIASPTPQSPSPTPKAPNLRSFASSSSQLRTLGIPLCDSPERERSNRVTSPLQISTTFQDLEAETERSERSDSFCSSGIDSSNNSSRSPEEDAAWQAHWAATLERKVTPPMPGFEVGPRESMRRMREEREQQEQRQHSISTGISNSPTTPTTPQTLIAHGKSQRSLPVTPTNATAPSATPSVGESPIGQSRALEGINEMIDELRDHLGVPPSNSNSSDTTSPTISTRTS